MSDSDTDEPPQLNASTLEILKQFAIEKGAKIASSTDDSPAEDIIESIHSYFALSKEDRKETFHVNYTSSDDTVKVSFDVEGVRRELGQTLDSTGLTM
jgi:hypothetical protein